MRWEDEGLPVLRSTAELLAGLAATQGMIERERRHPDPSARQEIIRHALRHDIYHAGELSVGLGAHVLPSVWG